MKWVRTFTGNLNYTLKKKHPIVYDPSQCEIFYLTDYNYLPLFEALNEDAVIIEWDIALSKEDRRLFERYCREAPGIVHVAPYKHYKYKPRGWEYGWVHRNPRGLKSVQEGEPECALFGFGLVYIPLWLVRAFLREMERDESWLENTRGKFLAKHMSGGHVTDVIFSNWHWQATGHKVPIHWDVRPVHLNY